MTLFTSGQRVHGYEIVRSVSRGGFGEVFHAIRLADGLKVALKALLDPSNPDARARFEREVRQLRALRNPRVVRLLDAHLGASPPFYVMPFAEGGTLADHAGKLSDEQVRSILRVVAEALVAVHERGHHLDLKPANLLLDALGHATLADFGLGNRVGCTVAFTCSAGGTAGYMAPEVARRTWPLDGRAADVFSLGVTVFNLLTGIDPQSVSGPFHSVLVQVRPNTAADLVGIVQELTRPHPSQRPTALQLLARCTGVPLTPVVRSASRGEWAQFFQAAAAATLVVAALGLIFSRR